MRIVLITGGSSGIGLATARKFALSGDSVSIVDLKISPEARALVESHNGIAFEQDVSDFKRAHQIIDDLVKQKAHLDVLINSAGISRDGTLSKLTEKDWDDVLDVDLKGVFNYISAATKYFKEQKSGKVVSVSSTVAIRGRRGLANYCAAKAGIIGLTRGAARDLGAYNINVNAVAPGLVDTPLTADVPQDVRDRLKTETCLGRLATPEDVANVIAFLCSEDARHITGEVIRIDGGQLS
ncbi:MAG: hypothetical protein A2W23_00095 [Planctomycetes bacterium RBG_16_43_13]|nr:MAG: hypothetical protein A2W23_00095 [Planctomycetes bacterium RBG_16_43_13]